MAELDMRDVRIDTWWHGDVTVKVTHLKTGRAAQATSRSQSKAREEALAILREDTED